MKLFKSLKRHLKLPLFGVILAAFLAIFAINTTSVMTANVYAEPAEAVAASDETCYEQVGAIGWLICPSTGVLAKAIDAIYNIIEELLTVQPLFNNDGSPIFQVWQIMRDITNVVFVVMLLIIVYSQITGLGITNYGIKKALPKLIISAVLVNLSFLICALAVDASNIIGASLRGIFEGIEVNAINSGGLGTAAQVTWTDLASALIGGGTVAGVAIGVAGGLGAFLWPVLAAMICGILSVLVGLITIGLRQALVAMLVMISPLAFVAYLLPNTEQYFKKWKDTLASMLVFYPMFSLLFGASQLAGWAIIASSGSAGNLGPFFVVLGMAVQVFPLFLSISLLKMSSTVLGTVSNKLDSLFNKPRLGVKAFADQQRQLAANRHINNSALPSAHLRRFLDGQKRKVEIGNENAEKIRRGNAEIWAQRRIAGMMHYDPADSEKYRKGIKQEDGTIKKSYLKASAFTRDAKMAGNIEMDVKTAQDDAKHLIANGYGEYYGKTTQDKALADHGARSFKEMSRASFTAVNDDEADFNYLTSEYLKAANAGHDSYQYKHFVESAGGSLGELGSTSVLGQLIAKAAANEARHRHDFGILGNKFTIDKRAFRNMVTGYYVNDDGLATYAPDENGNQRKAYYMDGNNRVYEQYPGEFLKYHPEALHPYQLRDENGPYYEMKDLNGDFVTRIYKHNTPVMKEIFQNFDTVIQDPIDGLYGMLAGIKEGTYSEVKDADGNIIARLPDVGFSNLRTTVGRSIQGANFKEKAAFAGPMYTTAVARGYIKNFTDNNIHRLDGIVKAVKAGNFNIQDKFELELLADLMNPENFVNGRLEYLFPYEDLKTAFDVNGKQLRGTKIDENGDTSDVEPENATYEELLNTIKKKYLFPASQAIAYMMSRATTPNVADAQKSGSAEAWGLLAKSIDKWTDPKLAKDANLPNPYKRNSNTADTAYEMQKKIRENSTPTKARSAYSTNNPASSDDIVRNHQKNAAPDIDPIAQYNQALSGKADAMRSQIEMFRSAYMYDPRAFGQAVLTMVGEDPEFEDIYFEFSNYVDDYPTATTEQLYQAITESLYRFDI
ncbi:MFS transporter [Candidatus Saccharibacteria bacterium]|nr:MFS transporter [Candidatus Saccharibacteria bacterium]